MSAAPSPMLEAALGYAARGWHVFRLSPRSKIPPAGSRGMLEATTDPAQIRAWWTETPDANIGLALAPSGLVAIDADGADWRAKVAALEAQYGALPSTLVQVSGGGVGIHALYKAPAFPIRGSIGPAGSAITLRGRAYLVVEPSIHPSGGAYRWKPGDAEVAELPTTWLEAIRRRADVEDADVPEPHDEPEWLAKLTPDERIAAARAHLERELGEVMRAAPGVDPRRVRPGMTWDVTRTLVRGYAIRDAGAAFELLRDVYNPKCAPPWPEARLARHIETAYTASLPEWGAELGPSIRTSISESNHATFASLIAAAAPPPGSFAALVAQARADVDEALAAPGAAGGELRPLFYPASELFTRDFPETPWLVRDLVTEGGTLLLSGEPKTAKTWALTEIALAVATGTPAFRRHPTGRARTVAYFFAEDLDRQVRNRLRALCAGRLPAIEPAQLGNLHVQPRGRFLDVTRDDDLALVVASCRALGGVDLLVLEPLRDLHSGEEDKSDSMGPVMRRLRVLGELLRCTVAVAHHSAKASADSARRRGGQRARGSGAIHGAIDCGIYLSDLRGDGRAVFTCRVDSEIKGARSAGHFDLTLHVRDDARGEAEHAAWSIEDAADAANAATNAGRRQEADDEAHVLAIIGASREPITMRRLRDGDIRGQLPEKRARAAADRLLEQKRLRTKDVPHPTTHRMVSRALVVGACDAPAERQHGALLGDLVGEVKS